MQATLTEDVSIARFPFSVTTRIQVSPISGTTPPINYSQQPLEFPLILG